MFSEAIRAVSESRRWSLGRDVMEDTAVLDASATAALSRRRKQSRPRQLASSLDSDTSADNQPGLTSALRVDNIREENCKVSF